MGPKPAGGGGQSGPSSKKQAGGTHAPNAARSDNFLQRRAQLRSARTIPAQPADAGLKDGELDLQAFVAAHEFEIRSLEQSMATSKAVGSSRAFQQVPRGLRRRTASHNPKRVPRRLRARANKEMSDDNTPRVEARRRKPTTTRARIRVETAKRLGILALRKKRRKAKQMADSKTTETETSKTTKDAVIGRRPRPKIRRNALNEPPRPPAKFRKRQINKTWLPTHMWHAKRARMTEPKNPLWRFAMPLTPNEKIYRPTHRAQGDRGTMVWDTCYMSTIGLYGNDAGLERVLKRIGVTQESCWNQRGEKWRSGLRSWSTMLNRESGSHRRLISPSTILWNPEPRTENGEADKAKKHQRQILLRVHPAAFLETFNELLRLTRRENPQVYIEDLRFEIGSIHLAGPASTETLKAILTPYPATEQTASKHAEVFNSLSGLTNPAMLPSNAMLSFSAQDPRLRYPPRKTEDISDPAQDMERLELIAKWPIDGHVEPNAIFDRDARHKASCLPSPGSINRRRGNKTPGLFLKPTAVDPPIPVTLLAAKSGTGAQTQGSWTLLAPWKCILPIWHSIVHCPLLSGGNPRFGGLNELMQVAFERGEAWFPADYPGTDAGAEWELEQRRRRKWDWDRRPKSKRLEWASLDLGAGRKGELGNGHACDFEFLFGLSEAENHTSQVQGADAMDVDEPDSALKSTKASPTPALKRLNHVPRAIFNTYLNRTAPPPPVPSNAIINVRITILSRGVATPCARIYRLPSTAPPPAPVASDAEVPASIPHHSAASASPPGLPHDLRSQWLSRRPQQTSISQQLPCSGPAKRPKPTDMETRKRLLAQELITAPVSLSSDAAGQRNQMVIDNGCHPLVPNAEDLVGFVTAGSFSLSEGRGAAMGSVAVDKVLPDVRENAREGRLCIVRNAGENVGWLARWDAT